ncbi:hypothetical protein CDL60_14665 [Roseateles noduli]|nr:hypothetical protein CDL60_14665 [Roseateles noduli]
MKRFLIAAALIAATTLSQARDSVPMVTPERATITNIDGRTPGVELMRKSIVEGSAKRGWRPGKEEPGRIELVYTKDNGRIECVIAVAYDADSLQMSYVSSRELGYEVKDGVPQIHPNYNKWLPSLTKDIQAAARR